MIVPGAASDRDERCGTCQSLVTVRQFSALWHGPGSAPTAADAALAGDGGVCFSHPESTAVRVCEGCGRFMCRQCDTVWDGEHLCLTCIHDRREVKQDEGFVSRRTLYDNLTLGVLAIPVILFYPFFFLVLFTGPIGLYYLIRYRGASRGFVPRGRFRLVLAWTGAVLSLLAGLGMIGLFFYAIFEDAFV